MVEVEEVLEVVVLVVVLGEADFVGVPHRSEGADLDQVERHLEELVLRE